MKDQLTKFSKERAWEKIHTPKNLAMELTVEVSELLENILMVSRCWLRCY